MLFYCFILTLYNISYPIPAFLSWASERHLVGHRGSGSATSLHYDYLYSIRLLLKNSYEYNNIKNITIPSPRVLLANIC